MPKWLKGWGWLEVVGSRWRWLEVVGNRFLIFRRPCKHSEAILPRVGKILKADTFV